MKTLKLAFLFFTAMTSSVSVASVLTKVLETVKDVRMVSDASARYAQVCLFNGTAREVSVMNSWGVGSAWQRTTIAPQTFVLYRLVSPDGAGRAQLSMQYRNRPYRLQRVEKDLALNWGAEPSTSCSELTIYELVERTEDNGSMYDELIKAQ